MKTKNHEMNYCMHCGCKLPYAIRWEKDEPETKPQKEVEEKIPPICTVNIPAKKKAKIPIDVKLLSFIKQKGAVTKTEIAHNFGGSLKAVERNAVLNTLEALGKIKSLEVTIPRGTNPTVYEYTKD